MGRHLSSKERKEVIAGVTEGKSYAQIAEEKGVCISTVSRILKRRRPRTIAKIARESSPSINHRCERCKKLESALLDMIIKM